MPEKNNQAGRNQYYDGLETMSAEARQAYFDLALGKAVSRAYRQAPSAREIMQKAGITPKDVKTMRDLEKLPVIRKSDLIDKQGKLPPYGGFYIGHPADIERIFVSPGPVYEPLHDSRIEWFAKSFWAAGFRRGDVVINTFTYHLSPAGTLFGEALRDCGATVVVAGVGNTDVHIRTMKDLGVTAFVGTPSYLLTIINKINENGDFKKEFKIKKAWFTGEMLSPSMRQKLEREYGIDTYQAYAVTEPGGALAYECPHKSGLHLMDEYFIEIIDPSTGQQLPPGEVGEVAVTPLHNKHWGLLRFGTGDLSKLSTAACPCGRTALKLTGILGRTGEAVKVRGMFVVPRQVESALEPIPETSRFQLIVRREGNRDELTLKVEVNEVENSPADLQSRIQSAFQSACIVKLDHISLSGPFPPDTKNILDERTWI